MPDTKIAPPVDEVCRQAPFTLTRTAETGDGLTLEGYAAVFDQPTLIDSWEGRFEEVIAQGAFERTIGAKGPKGIRLQFDHGSHPLIGSIPIGSITKLAEDDDGLFVRARLHDNWLIEPVRDAIREGSISGMSFRFRVVRESIDESDETLPVRTIEEIELFEVGPVVWPAYDQTSVGVRAQEIAQALMDPEQRLAVARALLIGTSDEEQQSTSEAREDAPSEPAPADSDEPAAPSDSDALERADSGSTDEPAVELPPRARRPRLTREQIRLQAAALRERMQGVEARE